MTPEQHSVVVQQEVDQPGARGDFPSALMSLTSRAIADLVTLPDRIDRLFAKYSSHAHKGAIAFADGSTVQAEVLTFGTSPRARLLRSLEGGPGAAKYSIFSDSETNELTMIGSLSAAGELLAGSQSALKALQTVRICEHLAAEMEVERKITGAPRFRSRAIEDFVQQKLPNLQPETARAIWNLPLQIVRASFGGEEQVQLGGLEPTDRTDLRFYKDGDLQIQAVRTACPALMQLHDILKAHGFAPILRAIAAPGDRSIPFLALYLKTEEATKLVEMAPEAPPTEAPSP